MQAHPRYRWLLFVAYLVVSGAPLLVQFSIGVMLPEISDDLALSEAQQGILGAVGWFATLVLYIPLSALMARYSPVHVTSLSTLFGVGAILLQVVAPNFALTLLGRFLLVVPTIAYGPARTLLMQQWFRPGEFTHVNGLSIAAFGVTELLAIWGSPIIIEVLGGWRAALFAYGVVNAASLVVWVVLARDHPDHDAHLAEGDSQGSLAALRTVVRRVDVWWLLLASVGTAMTWSSFFTFWPTYAVDSLDIDLETAGFIWGLGSMALTVMSLLTGRLTNRFPRRKPLIMLSFVLHAPTFLLMLSTGNTALLTVYAVLMGAAWFFIPILNTVPFELPRVKAREVAMIWSLFMVAGNLGTTTGPLFVGFAAGYTDGLALPLALSNLFLLFSVVGVLLLPETGGTRPRQASGGDPPREPAMLEPVA